MTIRAVIAIDQLDDGSILAPERYDPRRRAAGSGPKLDDVAEIVREQVTSQTADPRKRYLVLDTGDAQNGLVRTLKEPCEAKAIGSTKKRIRPGQVIISRLRPYLRQVAWIDNCVMGNGVELVASTEFYVLAARDRQSIAFLVPLLLSDQVQAVLRAAQEGGHHPRFNDGTLRSIMIPKLLLDNRESVSACVEESVQSVRAGLRKIDEQITLANTPGKKRGRESFSISAPAPAPGNGGEREKHASFPS